MTSDEIQRALADISAEIDPTLKHLKLASLVSAVFRERGIELIAVALSGQVELDWQEARRLAERPEYSILRSLEKLIGEVAHELGKNSPYHS